MNKRIFNAEKTQELSGCDLSKGRICEDRIFIGHHEATEEIAEQSREEIIAEYPSGGRDVKKVIEVPYQPAMEAWDEYEDIYVYIPYTEKELKQKEEAHYEAIVAEKIRRRYSLEQELAIHRQRETKPNEWKEYNAYCEQCKSEAKKQQKGKGEAE